MSKTKNNFKELVEGTVTEVVNKENEIKEIQEKLRNLQKDLTEKEEIRNYHYKLYAMVNWTEKPYTWHCRKQEGSSYQKVAWYEVYEYKTVNYEFTISMKERTDLKKMKWEVSVRGQKLTLAGDKYNHKNLGDSVHDTYRDQDYLIKKYRNYHYDNTSSSWICSEEPGKEFIDLEQKFSSEAKARTWANAWMAKLVEDHKEIIDKEVELYKQATEARPAMEKEAAAKQAAEKARIAEIMAKHRNKK